MASVSGSNLRPSKGKAFWEQHISNWQQSDLSKTAYCETHDLAKSTFDSWRRKQQSADTNKLTPRDFLTLRLPQNTQAGKPLFSSSNPAGTIEIQFQQGIVIKVNPPIDHEALFNVLQLVRQIS